MEKSQDFVNYTSQVTGGTDNKRGVPTHDQGCPKEVALHVDSMLEPPKNFKNTTAWVSTQSLIE